MYKNSGTIRQIPSITSLKKIFSFFLLRLLRTNDPFEVFYNTIVKNFKRIISTKQSKAAYKADCKAACSHICIYISAPTLIAYDKISHLIADAFEIYTHKSRVLHNIRICFQLVLRTCSYTDILLRNFDLSSHLLTLVYLKERVS